MNVLWIRPWKNEFEIVVLKLSLPEMFYFIDISADSIKTLKQREPLNQWYQHNSETTQSTTALNAK